MTQQSQGLSDFMDQTGLSDKPSDTEPVEQAIDEQIEEIETEVEPQERVDPEVEKASNNGWKPKDQWKGNPDDWVSAKKFNERGDMIGRIKQLENAAKQFDDRLANQRKLMDAQREQEVAKLEEQRKQAVELADVEKFNTVQKQLDDIKHTQPDQNSQTNNEQQTIDEFNAGNPWIFEDSPKAIYAKAMFGQFLQQGMNATQAIDQMQAAVNKHYPPRNERREQPATNESPRPSPKGKRREASLQWNQLTREEVQLWHVLGTSAYGGDKEKFLQAVKDSRG